MKMFLLHPSVMMNAVLDIPWLWESNHSSHHSKRPHLQDERGDITKGHLLICDGWFDTWIVQKSEVLDNDKRCC